MLPLLGAIVSGATSLIGGAMATDAQRQANDKNIAANAEANQKNYEAQKEFAQSGVRWRVDDAKAAGVHPLYALGAQTTGFSPSFTAGSVAPLTGMGDALASAGQDVGRAISTTQTPAERAYTATLQGLQLERAGLENELLRTQIRRTFMETGPAFPATESGLPLGPDLALFGGKLDVADHTSPAQMYQDQYGDIVENIVGVPMAVSDLVKHLWNGKPKGGSRLRTGQEPDRPPAYGEGGYYPHLGSNYSRTMNR